MKILEGKKIAEDILEEIAKANHKQIDLKEEVAKALEPSPKEEPEEQQAEGSGEYSKEFEEMYLRLFGTKPVRGNNLPVEEDMVAHGYYVADSAKYHVPNFLAAGATAILCGNDLIASGVITECQLRGFSVPDDISVIGFDDLPISSFLEPPLTTVRQERTELGKCGYAALSNLINHVSVSMTLLRPQLITRASTAPCAEREEEAEEE